MTSATGEPQFQIREYRAADFAEICAIDQACFSGAIAYSPEEMALGLLQRGAFAYLGESAGRVAGFVLASQAKRSVGHIITIDILPQFRRSGLGAVLMRRTEQRLGDRGAQRVVLEVSTENAAALRFYEHLGYRMKRLLPRYYPDGSDGYLLEKELGQTRHESDSSQ